MPSLSIVIPSRTQPRQAAFLQAALKSVRAQTVVGKFPMEIIVGIDLGERAPAELVDEPGVRFVEGYAKSQVAALNAAMRESTGAFVAILEDDDRWCPNYLELMVDLATHASLVTTNEIEVDESGALLFVSDCATPSAWLFRRALWEQVGEFDDAYRYHFDCDWLGRVREHGAARIHVVDANAPFEPEEMARDRPFLANIVRQNASTIGLAKHELKHPLVVRMRHANAGMEQIATQAGPAAQSQAELQRLVARYGEVPR
ncbi:glycosyltransferase family 2 protein [Candidatus Viadribacter manganicus]|uniref:Glycosyltransferase 2-like domain-containing protein n=1 Tax=Candidatus Viadribacter manganicus TaxID=1759059 RepID=A0A1B1AKZ5_9PROT|nr:glycosyltransferase family A protein [Candidatus Viadribacter manganicus]ANP47249.1 hypothetical protein ATE48_15630 [Candidatus Viadribacter manganicus]